MSAPPLAWHFPLCVILLVRGDEFRLNPKMDNWSSYGRRDLWKYDDDPGESPVRSVKHACFLAPFRGSALALRPPATVWQPSGLQRRGRTCSEKLHKCAKHVIRGPPR